MASEHIEEREGCYHILGTRISLDSIVYAFCEGCTPESIREDFNGLTLADVYGAIAYHLDHQMEIDSYLLPLSPTAQDMERQGSLPSGDLAVQIEQAKANRSVHHQ